MSGRQRRQGQVGQAREQLAAGQVPGRAEQHDDVRGQRGFAEVAGRAPGAGYAMVWAGGLASGTAKCSHPHVTIASRGPATGFGVVGGREQWRPCPPSPLPRPGLPRPGRQRDQRQRRAVRPAAEPDHARAGRPCRRGVRPHGQGLRRLGDPAPPRARARLGDRPARRARDRARRGRRHRVLQGQLPAVRLGRGDLVEGYPPPAELDAADLGDRWSRSRRPRATRENYYEVDDRRRWTHVRLTIYPDGGVARFRVHGEAGPDPRFLTGTVDLAALENGGRLLDTLRRVLLLAGEPDPARPGPDHGRGLGERAPPRTTATTGRCSRSAARGSIRHVEVDTSYFIGNAPGWVRMQRGRRRRLDSTTPSAVGPGAARPGSLVDTRHRFLVGTERARSTHLRLDVYPDGGSGPTALLR